jgi:hypothetical protein
MKLQFTGSMEISRIRKPGCYTCKAKRVKVGVFTLVSGRIRFADWNLFEIYSAIKPCHLARDASKWVKDALGIKWSQTLFSATWANMPRTRSKRESKSDWEEIRILVYPLFLQLKPVILLDFPRRATPNLAIFFPAASLIR